MRRQRFALLLLIIIIIGVGLAFVYYRGNSGNWVFKGAYWEYRIIGYGLTMANATSRFTILDYNRTHVLLRIETSGKGVGLENSTTEKWVRINELNNTRIDCKPSKVYHKGDEIVKVYDCNNTVKITVEIDGRTGIVVHYKLQSPLGYVEVRLVDTNIPCLEKYVFNSP